MLIHMLHCTVATKQPAMTAASFAEQVDSNEGSKAVDNKLAKLLIDVCRSQSVAVFGNVSIAVLLAAGIAWGYAYTHGQPLLNEAVTATSLNPLRFFTSQPYGMPLLPVYGCFVRGLLPASLITVPII